MNKFTRISLAAALALTTFAGSANAEESGLELSGNFGVTSDYVWRGMTQNMHMASVSGGVDAGFAGIYAGTWIANVNFGTPDYEQDLYAGYSGEVAGLGYDIGYILFAYPVAGGDFNEAYLGLSYSVAGVDLGVTYSQGLEYDGNDALGDNTELSIGYGMLSITAGSYTNNGDYLTAALTKESNGVEYTLSYNTWKDNTEDDAGNLDKSQNVMAVSAGYSF